MDKICKCTTDKLLSLVENYNPQRINDENIINEYSDVGNLLSIENPLHSLLTKSLYTNLLRDVINQKTTESSNKQRIKYKSQVNPDELEKIVNFSLWKNIPITTNLFNAYENKKNAFLKKQNSSQEDLYENNQSRFNNQRKFKVSNLEENDDEGISSNDTDYESYSNSIYNVNKKKNNNNNNNGNKNKFNNWKKLNEDEDEPEKKNYYNKNKSNNWKKHDEEDDEPEKKNNYNNKNKFNNWKKQDEDDCDKNLNMGFQSANNVIGEINKKDFKNNNTYRGASNKSILEDDDDEDMQSQVNKASNANKNKKFIPPYKTNGKNDNFSKNEKDKEIMVDEKLKGFDKKLIEFIESEILSLCPNVKWEDIAGLEFAKKTIKEIIIWPLLRPDIFNGIRRPPKGLLLFGPPGTGKTMIAKAIASESKSKFFNISASSLMSKWVGESEKLVRTLFALASFYQPSVVFIDEIDSILTGRSENECESSRRLKTEFLVQLDGAGTNPEDRILIIGATNRPQEIDDAFIRRLSKRLYIPLPNNNSRKQLIETVINKEKSGENKYDITEEDILNVVAKTKGYSGSDMMGVCREAAMMPIRSIDDISNIQVDNLRGVNTQDFIDALKLVKPSVSEKTIGQYIKWNVDFGSFQFDEKDNDN